MTIAVDTRGLISGELAIMNNFAKEVFKRLAEQRLEDKFIFFVDGELKDTINLPENVSFITLTPRPKNILLYNWWYNVKLPVALKKHKADLFIGLNGLSSAVTAVPQLLIVNDLAFSQKKHSSITGSSAFYKRNISRSIKKEVTIATLSTFVKKKLTNKFKNIGLNVSVIGAGTGIFFKPIIWEERELIKEQYASGYEYFVFADDLQPNGNLINVLKGFSIFKKWQKTNMKLLIMGKFNSAYIKELEKLDSYKYKTEVYVKNDLSEEQTAKVLASSYALIDPSYSEGFGEHVLEAIQCQVPVITTAKSSMSEVAGEAALYVDSKKPEEIAEQMKRIFKDEQLRNQLIEKGKQRAELFSWDKTSLHLWQLIQQAVSR